MMKSTSLCVILFGLIGFPLAFIAYKLSTRNKASPKLHKALFFPEKCTPIGKDEEAIQTLLQTVLSAKHSIVVCMYCFTSLELIDVLIEAHQRGVVVRVITDCEQESANGKLVSRLRRAGIQVRMDESSYFMHHKFAVLDEKVLVNGSLNWTLQGLRGNQENVIITNEFELVKAFTEQFESLWTLYCPSIIINN